MEYMSGFEKRGNLEQKIIFEYMTRRSAVDRMISHLLGSVSVAFVVWTTTVPGSTTASGS